MGERWIGLECKGKERKRGSWRYWLGFAWFWEFRIVFEITLFVVRSEEEVEQEIHVNVIFFS